MSRVCYAFQKGECTRGDECRFSHTGESSGGGGGGYSGGRREGGYGGGSSYNRCKFLYLP